MRTITASGTRDWLKSLQANTDRNETDIAVLEEGDDRE